MKFILSPAKSIDFEYTSNTGGHTQPRFMKESEKLVSKLKKLSPKKIGALMGISQSLSDLNWTRFQEWTTPVTDQNSKPVMFMFTGDVYRGLGAKDFNQKQVEFAQNHMRILSGLHGVLKPLDLIQPYRLEMGSRFAVTPKIKNLYQYWGDKITDALNEELDGSPLINLASNEYFKAIDPKKLKGKLITCIFMDGKRGDYKVVMTYAKQARGYMSRFIIQNGITNPDDLKAFDLEGYCYNNKLSQVNDLVFTRG